MAVLMRLAHGRFVNQDAKALAYGNGEKPIDRRQHLWVEHKAQKIVPNIVMNAHGCFLQNDIGCRGRQLEAGCKRNGANRTMRGDRDIIGFGHGGNPPTFAQAAGMAQIRLDDIHTAFFQKRLKVPARIEPFPERNWRAALRCKQVQTFGILTQYRLFHEQ